jgi:hypothetical protein
VHRVVNGKSPPESNRPKEKRKLLMILTVALLNGPFIACTAGKLPQQSQKVRKKIEDTIKISKSTLTLTLLDLGYRYKKIGDNRRLLYDQKSVINDHCNYLRKIRKFREDRY